MFQATAGYLYTKTYDTPIFLHPQALTIEGYAGTEHGDGGISHTLRCIDKPTVIAENGHTLTLIMKNPLLYPVKPEVAI